MPLIRVNDSVNMIFDLIRRRGAEVYAGEQVSQLEHFCQAAMMAERETCDEELILAAFLHDIGNLCTPESRHDGMNSTSMAGHEAAGARLLADAGFSPRIVTLVGNHVLAKRYLTYKYPDYYLALSNAGREALEFEGGPLCMDEAFQFEAHANFQDTVRLRRWDDLATQPGMVLAPLAHYREMAMYHLVKESNTPHIPVK